MLKTTLGVLLGRAVIKLSRFLRLGYGGTWPGEVALNLDPHIVNNLSFKISKIVLVAGTNGKTTTSLLIKKLLEDKGFKVIHNQSGANLLNGIASALIQNYRILENGKNNTYAVFEIDENSLPLVLKELKPEFVILLNLFRDQLDRYGEVDVIAEKWQKSLMALSIDTTVILNSDDPQIAYMAKNLKAKKIFFGLEKRDKLLKTAEHATDSIFCLNCGSRLFYKNYYYSHIGDWECKKCGLKRPKPDYEKQIAVLPGLYNLYNALAAYSWAKESGLTEKEISDSFRVFTPAFGRLEEINFKGIKIKIMLSKNPAGFNQSLETINDLKAQNLLVLLNDRIPDGRDISWIWDVDFEKIKKIKRIVVSGDRVYDLSIRLKYADLKFQNEEKLEKALNFAIASTPINQTLFILATYSAMLDVRKLLTGKRIL